jgi:nucleotide-binding universal stress UspA family protein
MKILLAIDGSEISSRAVKYVIGLSANLQAVPEIELLFVDAPILRAVAFELGLQGTEDYHQGNAKHALRSAKLMLTRAKLGFTQAMLVGDPSEQIIKHAKTAKCDLIVMGTRGHSALKGLLLGAVASKVIAHATVPVTVVR